MCAERFVTKEKSVSPTIIAVAHNQTDMIGNQVRHLFEKSDQGYVTSWTKKVFGFDIAGNFQQNIDMIKYEANPKERARMFLEFVYQLSERYRIGPEKTNDFGISYDTNASNPSKIIETSKLNCLSGNFSFGCLVQALAKETGVDATVVMREVVSVSGSDYVGHVTGQITIKGVGERFFDITNGSSTQLEFKKQKAPNEYTAGGYRYVFGASYTINDTTLHAAQIQEKLASGQKLSDSDAEFLVKMDPAFLTYLISAVSVLSEENMDKIAAGVGKIKEPNARLRLSLYMTKYYHEKGIMDKAREHAHIAGNALVEMIRQGRVNEIKFSPYLSEVATAFNILAMERADEAAVLYKMIISTLAVADTSEVEASIRNLGVVEAARFFKTLNEAIEKRTTQGYVFMLDSKAGINYALLESIAIARLLEMIHNTDFDKTREGRTIEVKLTMRLKTNCQELGLDYNSLTNVNASFLFNTRLEDNQKTRDMMLKAKLSQIWEAVLGAESNASIAKLREFYAGDQQGLAAVTKWIEQTKQL